METEEIMAEYDVDEEVAEAAGELIDMGLDEDEAIDIARDL